MKSLGADLNNDQRLPQEIFGQSVLYVVTTLFGGTAPAERQAFPHALPVDEYLCTGELFSISVRDRPVDLVPLRF